VHDRGKVARQAHTDGGRLGAAPSDSTPYRTFRQVSDPVLVGFGGWGDFKTLVHAVLYRPCALKLGVVVG
jgi:hypothetical protein